MGAVLLRPAVATDVPALAALYASAASTMGPVCYSAEQVAAWVRFGQDSPAFRAYVLEADTWVATDAAGSLLGFSGISATGEVHSLYVHPGKARLGIATRLLASGLERARARGVHRFAAWVTPLSRPVFERAGFRLVRTVREPFEGVEFERYRVELGS